MSHGPSALLSDLHLPTLLVLSVLLTCFVQKGVPKMAPRWITKTVALFSLCLLCAVSSDADSVRLEASDGASYFAGDSSRFSPDGRIPYGKSEVAVKREVLSNGTRLVETVTEAGAAPGVPPFVTVTDWRRREGTLQYDLDDPSGWSSGTMTFKDAKLSEWTVERRTEAGEKVTGVGRVTNAMLINEFQRQISGGRIMLVKEELKVVSAARYELAVGSFQSLPGTE